jgi:hypothetical protein
MKKFFAGMAFLILAAMNMSAQNITWNIAGANPSQYRSITTDELRYMFKNNQLAGNQRYKIIINDAGYWLTDLSLWELTFMSRFIAGAELYSRYFYFKNLPDLPEMGEGVTGRKIEVYFSQGVTLENLDDHVNWNNSLSKQVKISVIAVDGYRVL